MLYFDQSRRIFMIGSLFSADNAIMQMQVGRGRPRAASGWRRSG